MSKTINKLEKIQINQSEQWILIRGNSAKPLILQVQAGPGFPMIPDAAFRQLYEPLETEYLVVYWDQRGCGKSFNNSYDQKSLNFRQLTEDVIGCAEYLLKSYQKDQLILLGYSIGATLSLMAAAKRPEIFRKLILLGLDVDIKKANVFAREWMLNKAGNNEKLRRKIHQICDQPMTRAEVFQKRAALLSDLGGIQHNTRYFGLLLKTIGNMWKSPAYRLADIPRTIKGMTATQNALLPEMEQINLFETISSVEVPVHFVHGRLDGIAPPALAYTYFEFLQSLDKHFTWFEDSAHLPHQEETEHFLQMMRDMERVRIGG